MTDRHRVHSPGRLPGRAGLWVPMNELAAVQAHEQAQVDARAARYRARRRKRLERGEVYVRRKVKTKVPCSSDVR